MLGFGRLWMLVAAQGCSCGCPWPQHELQCHGLMPHDFCRGFRVLMVPLSAACGCSAVAGAVVALRAHDARSLASWMHQSVALRCARGRPLMLWCNCGLLPLSGAAAARAVRQRL